MIKVILSIICCGILGELQPLEVLERGLNEVLAINQKFSSSNQLTSDQHVNQLLEASKSYVDFSEMARRSFGKIWTYLEDDQKKEAQDLLAEILARSYVGKISKASRDSVKFLSQSITNDRAEVKSEVFDKDAFQKVMIIYRLKKASQNWKVFDVLVDNVSLTANYRSEFASIYDRKGYDGLIGELKQKLKTKKE